MSAGRNQNALLNVGLAAAVLAVYGQVYRYDFVELDDQSFVTDNPMVRRGMSADGLRWAFTTSHMGNWNPVTWLSHMLDVELFGLAPGAHHLVNLALHLANTLLLFGVLRRMTRAVWPSFIVAALFGLHPLHVESVAWISERKDVLSTLFWMLTLWAYARYADRPSARWYAAALAFFAIGLMAKPMLVTLPFVLLLLDVWPLRRVAWFETPGRTAPHRRGRYARSAQSVRRGASTVTVAPLLWEKVPFFVLTAAFSAAAYATQRHEGATVLSGSLPLGGRAANALVAYARYLAKTVWPVDLAVLYPYEMNLPLSKAVAAGLVLGAVTVALLRIAPRRPYALVGWLWFLGTLVPVIGLVQIGNQALADRFTYVPLIGIFIAIAWGTGDVVSRWAIPPALVAVVAAGLIGVLAITTGMQVALWRNGETLLSHAVRVTDANFVAHNNLGVALGARGEHDAALEHYREAVRIKPNYADAHDNLGSVLRSEGRTDEAIAEYRLAVRYGNAVGGGLRSHLAEVHHHLGLLLFERGELDEAIEHLTEAIRLEPQFAGAYFNLGNVYRALGRIDEAADAYRRALRIAPDDVEAHANLGAMLAERDRLEEAVAELETALRYDPHSSVALTNLGIALRKEGRNDEAIAALRDAVARTPDVPEARHELGLALIEAGDQQEAIEHLARVVELRPEQAQAHNDLGVALTGAGRVDEAIEHFREALRLDPNLHDAQYDLEVALTMKNAAAVPAVTPP